MKLRGLHVTPRSGEGPSNVIKRFLNAVRRSGLSHDLRRHQEFMSRAERRRLKRVRALKRVRRERLRAAAVAERQSALAFGDNA